MRFSFLVKGVVVVALVLGFDRLFQQDVAGARIGGFALLWLAGLMLARRDVVRSGPARLALGIAALFAGALVDDPGPLAWLLFWAALSVAALLPRAGRIDDAWLWGARLAIHALAGIARPIADLRRVVRTRRGGRTGVRGVAAMLALPVVGAVLFVALFAAANPLIATVLAAVRLPSVGQMALWAFVAACIWPSLRPSPVVMRWAGRLPDPEPVLPGTSLPSVLIALALFNAIFAVQNALDLAFLWSGGALPAGVSQTDYVHRGAYPLIGTALIAGVMALAMLRPGSAAAGNAWARRLVTLWVVQNLVLVASSVLRTIDYIDASMLTAWRIAALAWMALVALGLGLIGWRILGRRSARWLINRNALAMLLVLAVFAVVDPGAIAATWNVRHQAPAAIDLCYLNEVGDGALVPLIELERRPMDAATRGRVRHVRDLLLGRLDARQSVWTRWTPRGARRLARALAALGPAFRPVWPVDGEIGRACDGSIVPAARAS